MLVKLTTGHISVVEILLENGANIEAKNLKNQTSLHLTAIKGHFATMKMLIEKGARRDEQDLMGKTAFHLAAREGHLPQVHFLLEAGSPTEMPDKQGKTALHLSAREGNLMVVEYLLDQVSISPTFYAQLLCEPIPKVQKDSQLKKLFSALSGSKHVDEIDPGVDFPNILHTV